MNESLFGDFFERSDKLYEQALLALAHLPREHAMCILLSWIGLDRLEEIMPTLMGEGPAPEIDHYKYEFTTREVLVEQTRREENERINRRD